MDPHNCTFLRCWTRWTCLGHAMCSDNGVTHQSARPVYSRTLRCRQVQIDGNPHPGLDWNRYHWQPQDIVYLQRKLRHSILCWPAPMAVGDQERNKSSYSHTKFDIHPRERRQMLNKCQLILATGCTVAQDLTMQWSTLGGFMQELSLMVIDEGQQYGTDREIAVISLMRQQPLVLWTGDSEQTPGGIDRAARNAKRSRQLLLSKKHGLRSDRNYYMPANLADAMIRLLDGSSNEGLTTLSQILRRGQHTLGQLWTSQLLATSYGRPKGSQYCPPRPESTIWSRPATCAKTILHFRGRRTTGRHNRQLPTVPGPPCLDLATCRHPPTHGWRHPSSFKLSDRRSKRHPCLGVDAPVQFKSQSCDIPLRSGSSIPWSLQIHQRNVGTGKFCLRRTSRPATGVPIRAVGHQC